MTEALATSYVTSNRSTVCRKVCLPRGSPSQISSIRETVMVLIVTTASLDYTTRKILTQSAAQASPTHSTIDGGRGQGCPDYRKCSCGRCENITLPRFVTEPSMNTQSPMTQRLRILVIHTHTHVTLRFSDRVQDSTRRLVISRRTVRHPACVFNTTRTRK